MTSLTFCHQLAIILSSSQVAGAIVSQLCWGQDVCLDQPHPTTSNIHTSKASYLCAGAAGEDLIWNHNVQHHPRHDQRHSAICLTLSDFAIRLLEPQQQPHHLVNVKVYAWTNDIQPHTPARPANFLLELQERTWSEIRKSNIIPCHIIQGFKLISADDLFECHQFDAIHFCCQIAGATAWVSQSSQCHSTVVSISRCMPGPATSDHIHPWHQQG